MSLAQVIITLSYRRHAELVKNAHLFSGTLVVQGPDGVLSTKVFSSEDFTRMYTAVARELRTYPDAPVALARTDREGLAPFFIAEELRVLLRDDPVRALESMNPTLGGPVKTIRPLPALPAAYDALAESFGEEVYLRARGGCVEDPATGTWASLAYTLKTQQWSIRGAEDKASTWLPIRFPELVITNLEDEQLPEQLIKCSWAAARVIDILALKANRFFLPRLWNTEGQWISRTALKERLAAFTAAKKEVMS